MSAERRRLPAPVLPQRVHIIGSGLIGTSLAMALVRAGVVVSVADASPTNEALASDLSGARLGAGDPVDLVVVATPPDVTAQVITAALAEWPNAVVTDVASVKEIVQAELVAIGVKGLERYVGGHPMAGRERSGAIAARIDLFEGRPWVVTAGEGSSDEAVALVRGIAEATGAVVRLLTPAEHDAAVAAVSHVPQVVASLVAARLADLSEDAVGLSGTGIRDVTRIAASDPVLWTQILTGNARAVADVLRGLADDLGQVVAALDALATGTSAEGRIGAPGARAVLATAIAKGNTGHARIPGKHGAAPAAYSIVTVLIPDQPGQLGRLFQDVGDAGINLEELNLEHNLGQPFGQLELSVLPAVAGELAQWLTGRGWRIHA
ncbi:MAG: prephenate dehydrogenase [Actinobacteria bacterium]|nr:prephenate dehydrogenase [Actinomycetota bacterium]